MPLLILSPSLNKHARPSTSVKVGESRKLHRLLIRTPRLDLRPISAILHSEVVDIVPNAQRSKCGADVAVLRAVVVVPSAVSVPVVTVAAVPACTTLKTASIVCPVPLAPSSESLTKILSLGERLVHTAMAEPHLYKSPITMPSSHAFCRPATVEATSEAVSE